MHYLRIFIASLFCFLALPAKAATGLSSVIFTNLDSRDFIVDFTGAPTNIVRLNLDPTQFDTNVTNIHIDSNVDIGKQYWTSLAGNLFPVGFGGNTNRFLIRQTTGFTGTGTNYFGDDGVFHPLNVTIGTNDLWAAVGNVYFPAQAEDSLIATNINSAQALTALGAFVLATSLSSNLVAGDNDLSAYQVGTMYLAGPTATPTDTTISLNAGNATGQIIIIENAFNNLGFSLTNGTPQWDASGTIILAAGDWKPTRAGETIILIQSQLGNWQEATRFGGTSIAQNDHLWATNSSFGTIGPLMAPIRFQIDANGNIVKLRSVTTSFPSSQGAAGTFLKNDGSGNLTWAAAGGATINPTDQYQPYRLNANAFGDSQFQQINATNSLMHGSLIGTNGSVFTTYSDGTKANPAFSFGGLDNGYGLYRDVNGEPSMAIGGLDIARFSASGFRIPTGNSFDWSNGSPDTTPIKHGIYDGNGSPEGAQVANVGSLYLDYNAGGVWKKVSGPGTDTGWVELAGGGGGGTTINPTDAYVPVRANSTTFNDSYLAKSAANEMYFTNSALKVDNDLTVNPRLQDPNTHGVVIHGDSSSHGTTIRDDHVVTGNNTQNRIGTSDAFNAYGFTADGTALASAANPQQFSPNVDWIGMAYSTNAGAPRTVAFGSQVQTFGAADEPTGVWTLVSHINGAAVTNFTVSSASGWTGTGANVFKDDGTFGPSGGGTSYWQTNTGSASISPLNTGTGFYIRDNHFLGMGETNIFDGKDIGIFRKVDTEGATPVFINTGIANTWPSPTYYSEWWSKLTTNEAVQVLVSSSSLGTFQHSWTAANDNPGSFFYYQTLSNNVPTFELSGEDGDLSIIKSVPYSWPTANAAGVQLNDGSGTLSFGKRLTGAYTITNTLASERALSLNAPFGTTNDILRVSTGTASDWNVPTLQVDGFTRPQAIFAADSTNVHKSTIFAAAGGDYAYSLNFLGSGGTLANPNNSWTGGMMALNTLGWVGGSVNDWRTFTVIEAGNRGGNPTSAANQLGRIQLGACNGDYEIRPGIVVYNDKFLVTDYLPTYYVRQGHSNVFNGLSDTADWAVNKFVGRTYVQGTEGTVDNTNVIPAQVEIGGALISQWDTNGFMLGKTRTLTWSSATGAVGTAMSASQLTLTNVSAGVLSLEDGATTASFRVPNGAGDSSWIELSWASNVGKIGTGAGTRRWRLWQGGTDIAQLDAGGYGIENRSDMYYAWHSNTAFGGVDTALSRKTAGVVNVTTGYAAGNIAGITTTWTNMISGVITQRISAVGGIIVTNLTL